MGEWRGKIFYMDDEHRLRAFPARDEAHETKNKPHTSNSSPTPFAIPKAAKPMMAARQQSYAPNAGYKIPTAWDANQTAKDVPDTCYVAPSSLGNFETYGYGLFAKTDLQKGDFITNYGGIKLHTKEDVRGSSSKYVITGMDHGTVRDAKFVQNASRDRGRWINDPHGTTLQPNVIAVESAQGTISIVADNVIKKGEELLMDYGTEYWKS